MKSLEQNLLRDKSKELILLKANFLGMQFWGARFWEEIRGAKIWRGDFASTNSFWKEKNAWEQNVL